LGAAMKICAFCGRTGRKQFRFIPTIGWICTGAYACQRRIRVGGR